MPAARSFHRAGAAPLGQTAQILVHQLPDHDVPDGGVHSDHHFLNPVVAMVSFLLFEREPRLPLASVPLALVPTIVYGVYDLWGNITGRIDGPYPFMRVYDQTIQESLMWFAIILGTNLLYAFVLWWLGGNGKKHRKKGPKLEFVG